MKTSFYLYFLLLSTTVFSQEFKQNLESIKTDYQICLNKGKVMYNCSLSYYKKSDSLLNVVYNYIRKDMTVLEKNKLKQEQLIWLKERDHSFNKMNSKNEGMDALMIQTQKKSDLINKRTSYLINHFIEHNP